jgi:hypothetical protein
MPWIEIISLIALLAAGWFWLDSFKAREAGISAARAACAADQLLLLDDTVALGALRPERDEAGQLRWRRVYDFEYSDTGNNRRRGNVTLLGEELVMLYVGPRLAMAEHMLESASSDHQGDSLN